MDPIKIIGKYYEPGSKEFELIIKHGEAVARKALLIASRVKHLNPDLEFIREAAMLHDIGMFKTFAPELGCFGKEHYMKHGVIGKEILEKEGFPRHAMVCERHIGLGLSAKEIERENFPLELRDMIPITIEEQIISFADIFFSKLNDNLDEEKTVDELRKIYSKFAETKLRRFEEALKKFGGF